MKKQNFGFPLCGRDDSNKRENIYLSIVYENIMCICGVSKLMVLN